MVIKGLTINNLISIPHKIQSIEESLINFIGCHDAGEIMKYKALLFNNKILEFKKQGKTVLIKLIEG